MTVETNVLPDQYAGNGVARVFDFSFAIYDEIELVASLIVNATGVRTVLVEGVDYTITVGIGESDGGSITTTVAPPNGTTLDLRPVYLLNQPTDFRNQGKFFPETHELAFDRQAFVTQYLRRLVKRCLHIADYGEDGVNLQVPFDRAGRFLAFGAAKEPVAASGTGNDSALRADLAAGTPALVNSLAVSYIRTAAEFAAGVTPTNFAYSPGDVRRYGVAANGSANDAPALTTAAALNLLFPAGTNTRVSANVTLTGNVVFERGATVDPDSGVWVRFNGRVEESGQSIIDSTAAGNVILTNNPQYSYKNATYNVVTSPSAPNDFATVQAAFNAIPRYISHAITVEIANATWAETPTLTNKHLINSSPAELFINGDPTTPANVVINGLLVRDITGYLAPKFDGFKFSGGLGDGGGNETVVQNINCFTVDYGNCVIDGTGLGALGTAQNGIIAYASTVNFKNVQINNCRQPAITKHGGQINSTLKALRSTGATFFPGASSGYMVFPKMVGAVAAGAAPVTSSTNAIKDMVDGLILDPYMGYLHGPSFFLTCATNIEHYFTTKDGFTDASSGGGTTTIGADGLRAQTGGGIVSIVLDRDVVTAPTHVRRPIFFMVALKITTLPSGETVYVGTGFPAPSTGDFIGFKITSTQIHGITRLAGVETATLLAVGGTGLFRLGFVYAPGTDDTKVEDVQAHYATFFHCEANASVRQTMGAALTDTASLDNRFTLYCDESANPIDIHIGGFRYVKV